jgi:hypothetical protein
MAIAGVSMAQVPIRELPGASSISTFEQTGAIVEFRFDVASPALAHRLDFLSEFNADFRGSGGISEDYDVFYSDANGTPNVDGAYLTIEVLYAGTDGGGNINEVRLNRQDGSFERACILSRIRSFGDGAVPVATYGAVDTDRETTTFLGQSTDQNNRLSLTIGFLSSAQADCTCYPNCDGSTTPPVLSAQDFACFLARFRAGDSDYANCDESTIPPILNPADFTCFLSKFRAGCL